MTRYLIGGALVCLLAITAGCLGGEAQSEQWNYVDGAGLRFDGGSEFTINGTVSISLTQNNSEVFEDVTMCLYAEDGKLLEARNLGDFEAQYERKTVNVTIDTRPRYVIVDHPRFENYQRFGPLVVRWTGGGVSVTSANPSNEITEFAYLAPQTAGECGTTSAEPKR